MVDMLYRLHKMILLLYGGDVQQASVHTELMVVDNTLVAHDYHGQVPEILHLYTESKKRRTLPICVFLYILPQEVLDRLEALLVQPVLLLEGTLPEENRFLASLETLHNNTVDKEQLADILLVELVPVLAKLVQVLVVVELFFLPIPHQHPHQYLSYSWNNN